MRMPFVLVAVLGVSLAANSLAVGQSQPREKVAEGQYGKYRDGKLTAGTGQSWVLWRTADGQYELQDQFHLANPAAQLAAAIGSGHLSRQLQREVGDEVAQTEVDVRLSADLKPESLTVRGTRLTDSKPTEIANCVIGSHEIKCKGLTGTAKLSTHESRDFFYSFPFPMLVSGLLKRGPTELGERVAVNLSVLSLGPDVGKPKPKLANSEGELTLVAHEQIQLEDRTYNVNKYVLEIHSKIDPLRLSLWANKNLVVAMEEASIPGERLQLVAYKKFADF